MKITNIGILNIQTASQSVLEQCEEISNVGFMVGSKESFEEIQPCRISNVGVTIMVPAELPLVFHEEDLKINDDFLASLPKKTVFVINGDCVIQSENISLIQDRVEKFVVNGNTYCPSSIKGLLSTMGRFNGRFIPYTNGANFFLQPLELTESLLFRLPKQISTNHLRALSPTLQASAEPFESIEVLDSCWIERSLFMAWKDKLHLDLGAELHLLDAPVRYHKSSESMTVSELAAIKETTLAVDGTLTITGNEFIQPEHVSKICCKTLRARQIVIASLKDLLLPGIMVEALESNKRINHGKLILSSSQLTQVDNPMRLKNYASLVFDESITPDMIKKGIAQIENYGVVKAPEALMTIITEKTSKNFGKIKPIENLDVEIKKEYAYENFGYLAL